MYFCSLFGILVGLSFYIFVWLAVGSCGALFFQNMCVGINKTRCSEISTMNRAAVQARCILEWALNMQPVWLQAIWWLSDFGCQLMLKHPVLVLLENSVFSQKNNRVSDLKKTHGYKLDWLINSLVFLHMVRQHPLVPWGLLMQTTKARETTGASLLML